MQDTKAQASFKSLEDLYEALFTPGLRNLVWDLSDVSDEEVFLYKMQIEAKEVIDLLKSNGITLDVFSILHSVHALQQDLIDKHPGKEHCLRYFDSMAKNYNSGEIMVSSTNPGISPVIFKPIRSVETMLWGYAEDEECKAAYTSLVANEPARFSTLKELDKLVEHHCANSMFIWECETIDELYSSAAFVLYLLGNQGIKIDLKVLHNDVDIQQIIDKKASIKTPAQAGFFEIIRDCSPNVKLTLEYVELEKMKSTTTREEDLEAVEEELPPSKKRKIYHESQNSNPVSTGEKSKDKPQALAVYHNMYINNFFYRNLIAKHLNFQEKEAEIPMYWRLGEAWSLILTHLTDNDIKHGNAIPYHLSYTAYNQPFYFPTIDIRYDPIIHPVKFFFSLTSLTLQHLHGLFLPNMKLGDKVMTEVCAVFKRMKPKAPLKELDLSNNNLSVRSAYGISSMLDEEDFDYLNFSRNPFGVEGLKVLVSGGKNKEGLTSGGLIECSFIETLDLSYTNLIAEEETHLATPIFKARSVMRSLGAHIRKVRSFTMQGNNISDEIAESFFQPMVTYNNNYREGYKSLSLYILDLSMNKMHRPLGLLEILNSSSFINYLSFRDNPLDIYFSIKLTDVVFSRPNMVVFEINSDNTILEQGIFYNFLASKGSNPKLYLLQFKSSVANCLMPESIKCALEENKNSILATCDTIKALEAPYEVLNQLGSNERTAFDSLMQVLRHAPPLASIRKWGESVIQEKLGEKDYEFLVYER